MWYKSAILTIICAHHLRPYHQLDAEIPQMQKRFYILSPNFSVQIWCFTVFPYSIDTIYCDYHFKNEYLPITKIFLFIPLANLVLHYVSLFHCHGVLWWEIDNYSKANNQYLRNLPSLPIYRTLSSLLHVTSLFSSKGRNAKSSSWSAS